MADEIAIQGKLAVTNGNNVDQWSLSQNIDQAAEGQLKTTFDIGTSEEALSLGDLSSPGMAMFMNLDDTNFVTWGPESGGAMVAAGVLYPGVLNGPIMLDPSITIRMQADTANCLVKVFILEA